MRCKDIVKNIVLILVMVSVMACTSAEVRSGNTSANENNTKVSSVDSTAQKMDVADDANILAKKSEDSSRLIEVYDPWEGFNRRMYYFNAKFDRYVYLPVVDAYEFILPKYVRTRVNRFFKNLGEIKNFTNSLLQRNGNNTLTAVKRFGINSTVGVLGMYDVATKFGIEERKTDFGLTLAKYGVDKGPYIVFPILGPTTLRDVTGKGIDIASVTALDPIAHEAGSDSYEPVKTAVNVVDTRSNINFRYYNSGSPFEYEMVRYIYTKMRELEYLNMKYDKK